jgi:hypothetical protein
MLTKPFSSAGLLPSKYTLSVVNLMSNALPAASYAYVPLVENWPVHPRVSSFQLMTSEILPVVVFQAETSRLSCVCRPA